MLKLAFWGLIALDVLGVGLLLLLGLAAAGSARTSPALVTLLLFVVPCIALVGAIALFLRATSPVGRVLALLLAAAPLGVLVAGNALARLQVATSTNARGEMTYYRAGPMREIAEAIMRDDAATVASLAPTVNVNSKGMSDITLLVLAARRLRDTPERHDVLRALLRAGADPDVAAQYELPLAIAIQQSGKAGVEPVKMMLDAGADPNLKSSFGEPVFFGATGITVPVEVLALLLDRGANVNAESPNGSTALFSAANARNWKAALLLLDRGADPRRGKSANGMPFRSLVDGEAGSQGSDSAYVAVRRRVQ